VAKAKKTTITSNGGTIALLTYRGEPEPTAWAYDRVLLAEARRRGIGLLPRVNAVNEPWRQHLEQQIGHKVVMEILFRRKRGQRGPGKQRATGATGTRQKILAQRREAYRVKKQNPYRAK
jgi:hypothetical protein